MELGSCLAKERWMISRVTIYHTQRVAWYFSSSKVYWLLRKTGCCCLVTKSCPTLCDLMDCSPPGSSVHGISQSRILEWVAISFSRGSSWPRDWIWVSCIARGFFTTEPPGKPQNRLSWPQKYCIENGRITIPFALIYSGSTCDQIGENSLSASENKSGLSNE